MLSSHSRVDCSALLNSVMMISDVEQSVLSSGLDKEVEGNESSAPATCGMETSDGGSTLFDTESVKNPSSTLSTSAREVETAMKDKENPNAAIVEEEDCDKEGKEEEKGEAAAAVSRQTPVLRRSGRLSACQRDSVSISELAKKVQLRVKRVRRAAKPNLSVRQNTLSEVKEVKGTTSLEDAFSEVTEMKHETCLLDAASEIKEVKDKAGIIDAVSEVNEVRTKPCPREELDGIPEDKEMTLKPSFQMERRHEVSEAVEIKVKTSHLGERHVISEVKEERDADINAVQEPHSGRGEESLYKISFQTFGKTSMSVEESPYELEDISNSGTAASLKETILWKSGMKYSENCVDDVKLGELDNIYNKTERIETSVTSDECLGNAMTTGFVSFSQSFDADAEQCVSHTDQVEVKKHMDDVAMKDIFTKNETRISEDNEYSSRDCYQREHASSCGSPRECSSMHGRFEGHISDISVLNLREKPVLETLLPDEPPGFSVNERATDAPPGQCVVGPNYVMASDRTTNIFGCQTGNPVSTHHYSIRNDKADYVDSKTIQERWVRSKSGNATNHSSVNSLCKRSYFQDQAQPMTCDIAEGHMWRDRKRPEQREESEGNQLRSSLDVADNRLTGAPPFSYEDQCAGSDGHGMAYNQCYEAPECATDCYNHYDESQGRALNKASQHNEPQKYGLNSRDAGYTPFSHLIQLNWKCSSDAGSEKSNNNNMKIVKERSVFVGCIPDGIENLDLLLRVMMEQFLERFDFAPARLGQVQLIKTVKDFAFIELATEKVAQIVLSANQLDVFEWGINGYHFNIQGCTATYTSVRPLIEYMPLKPGRVVFVGNIPKLRWRQDFLDSYFTSILHDSDGPPDWTYVSHVYLLPESSDAYVEMTSELLADALLFKCGKDPGFLREIGPDVFICRDRRSIPLMSRHKGTICPQRSLYIGITPPGVEFKIDYVMKTIGEVLPFIARNSNQRGYLEYVNLQPGKDYAFFQFNSEAFVDAIMDEYIENTHIFICRESKVPYIILRPPGYVRPEARHVSDIYNTQPFISDQSDTEGSKRARSGSLDPDSSICLKLRRFGDEPVKKPDCIISIGASPLPSANWNEFSTGLRSSNPDCMIVIEGLSIKHNYRLIRGALNELLERCLWHSGWLEAGTLIVRYLEQDGNFVVATLTNADFVSTLLLMRKVFVLAGQEISLLPEDCRKNFHWNEKSTDLYGDRELSYSSDEDSHGRAIFQKSSVECNLDSMMQNDRRCSDTSWKYQPQDNISARRNMNDHNPPGYDSNNRRNMDHGTYPQSGSRQRDEGSRNGYREIPQWHNIKTQQQNSNMQVRAVEPFLKTCEGNNPRARVLCNQKGSGFPNSNCLRGEGGSRTRKNCPDEGFRTINREVKRTLYSPSICESERLVEMGRKRKTLESSPENTKRFNSRRVHHNPSIFP